MTDIEITQKEIEDKLFDFIEENSGKKRYECFNEVVNFVEYEIISILSSNNDDITDLEIENKELENSVAELEDNVAELKNAFDSLKDDCCDRLKEIESNLKDIIENNELDFTIDKLKELKDDVEHQHWTMKNSDVDDF